MIALFRYSHSPLDDSTISLDGMAAYGSDHNQRMSANNPNGTDLTARIAATAAALDAFHDTLDSDLSRLGIRKGAKLVKNNFRLDLTREAEKVVAAVVAEFGSESPEVLSVIPQGRTVFSRSRDDRLQDHLQTLVSGVEALEATLGAALTVKATALRDDWDVIYQASEESTGVKIATVQTKWEARDALSWELYRNIMAIADLFPRDPDKMRLYCNQTLLGIPEPTGFARLGTSDPVTPAGSTGSTGSVGSTGSTSGSSIGSTGSVGSSMGSSAGSLSSMGSSSAGSSSSVGSGSGSGSSSGA